MTEEQLVSQEPQTQLSKAERLKVLGGKAKVLGKRALAAAQVVWEHPVTQVAKDIALERAVAETSNTASKGMKGRYVEARDGQVTMRYNTIAKDTIGAALGAHPVSPEDGADQVAARRTAQRMALDTTAEAVGAAIGNVMNRTDVVSPEPRSRAA